jgi:hypothetical protein
MLLVRYQDEYCEFDLFDKCDDIDGIEEVLDSITEWYSNNEYLYEHNHKTFYKGYI